MRRLYKLAPILVAFPVYAYCKDENAKGWNLYAWGSGRNGELGLGIEANKSVPTLLQSIKFKDVSARKAYSAGVTIDGKLYTWGNARNGVLGHDSSNLNVLVPKEIPVVDEQFKQVSCGYQHMCAVTKNGEVYIWGNVDQQEVKFRSVGTVEQDRKVVEKKVRKVESLKGVKEVACSAGHTVALTTEGKLYTWGNKKTIGREGSEDEPHLVDLQDIVKVACGIDFTLAVDKKGRLFAWGNNGFGQLGIPSVKSTNVPHLVQYLEHQQVVDVSCGDNFAGVITKSGQVFTWGFGNEGQLGHGDKFDQTIPRSLEFKHVPVQISCGGAHTALLTKNNELFLFGRGKEGQIGVQEKAESNTVQKNRPRFVDCLKNVIIYKIVCGGNHTMALTA